MPVTAADQFEISASPALLMGVGTSYDIIKASGLLAPPTRSSDLDFVGDGVFPARDTRGPRTISLDVEISGTPGSDLLGKVVAFVTAWEPSNTNIRLTWRLPGHTTNRYTWGRPRRLAGDWDAVADVGGVVKAFVDFFAPLPQIYDASDDSLVVF